MVLKSTFRDLYIVEESSYAQAPRPADTLYRAVPTYGGNLTFADARANLETNRNTGRPGRSEMIPGPAMANLTWQTNMYGFPQRGGPGVAPPAFDWLDLLLRGVSESRDVVGQDITAATGADVTFTSTPFLPGEPVPILEPGTPNPTVRWAPVFGIDGAVTQFLRVFSPPVNVAGNAPACRIFRDTDGLDTSITLASAFRRKGDVPIDNACPGGRINTFGITATRTDLAAVSWGLQADDNISDTFVFDQAINGSPAQSSTPPMRLAGVWIDGERLPTAQIGVTWTIETFPIPDTLLPNGRSDHILNAANPQITLQPLYTEVYEEERRVMPIRDILAVFVQSVRGMSDGTEQVAMYFPQCQLSNSVETDGENNRLDATLTYDVLTRDERFPRWTIVRI